ncbi:MAG: radical SAM/SPASM domain-containing protein [Pirellulaceae bacterium]
MEAKIGSRFTTDARTKLEEVIPLDTPFMLFIDPSSACNFRCRFCPCGGGNRDQWAPDKKPTILSYELFRSIVDDACTFPAQIKTLRLYKEGEPLLNKRLPDMIRYARQSNVAKCIDFTSNGSLLTPDLNLALIDAGVDRINLSVESLTEEGYRTFSGVKIDLRKFLATLRHLYRNKQQCHLFLKIHASGLEGRSEEDFYAMFGDLCDEIAVEHTTPVWPGFDLGHVQKEFQQGIYGNPIRDIAVCPYIFYSLCVNSDGTVSACLMDWNHQLIVGDAKTSSVVDIWNNRTMHAMRVTNLEGKRREMPVCAECGQLPYAALDCLDDHREQLLERINDAWMKAHG